MGWWRRSAGGRWPLHERGLCWTVLYWTPCTVLYCTVLYCTVLYCTWCTVPSALHTVLVYSTQYTAYCTVYYIMCQCTQLLHSVYCTTVLSVLQYCTQCTVMYSVYCMQWTEPN